MTKMQRTSFTLSAAGLGFLSISAQIIMMRELITVFFGHELVFGFALGLWLLLTALGSRAGQWHQNSSPRYIGSGFLLYSLLLPACFFAVLSTRHIWSFTTGEMGGMLPMTVTAFVVLAPLCLASGYLYTAICRHRATFEKGHGAITKTYFFETVGAGAGGFMVSLLFIRYFSHAAILLILMALSAGLSHSHFSTPPESRLFRRISCLLITAVLIAAFFSNHLQRLADKWLWKGHHLILSENSPYGAIAVTRFHSQDNLYQNGIHLFSLPDAVTAEAAVHYAMLQHENPSALLMVGGGLGGGLEEALKYKTVREIHYVDIDPKLISTAIRLSSGIQTTDERIHYHYMDGRLFIKQSNRLFDVIILNLPNPYTAQINRFYTVEFFHEVKRILKANGVFSLTTEASENVISPELGDFLSTINATLKKVFPRVIALPGETIRWMASEKVRLTGDPEILMRRLAKQNIQTRYVREYYVTHDLSSDRFQYLAGHLNRRPPRGLNRDFEPVAYYFNTILWSAHHSRSFLVAYRLFSRLTPMVLTVAIFFATAALMMLHHHKQNSQIPRFASIWSVGITEISLEIVFIIGFQVLYGYVYQQLASLAAAVMGGLALGAGLAGRIQTRNLVRRCFLGIQGMMCVYPWIVMGLLSGFQKSPVLFPWAPWIFPVAAAVSGFLGGAQFSLANRILVEEGKTIGRTAGRLYSMDLAGSAAGAFLVSAFMIPWFGLFSTLRILGFMNIGPLLLLLYRRRGLNPDERT
ncbi:MAG TPA: hypothetical protein ENN03_09550 [bacterium]|nr:hypothetical protein [bacterium]